MNYICKRLFLNKFNFIFKIGILILLPPEYTSFEESNLKRTAVHLNENFTEYRWRGGLLDPIRYVFGFFHIC